MNPVVKEKWIKALESGEYKQTDGVLRYEDRYCCLGVLCDLYAKEHNVPWEDKQRSRHSSFLGEGSVLPEDVMKWAEIDSESGCYRKVNGFGELRSHELTDDNDNGQTFLEIAKTIKEHF